MEITLNRLAFQFDNNGNTSSVSVGLNGSEDSNAVSATLQITPSDLPSGKTLDDLTKADFGALAKTKLAGLTAVKSA